MAGGDAGTTEGGGFEEEFRDEDGGGGERKNRCEGEDERGAEEARGGLGKTPEPAARIDVDHHGAKERGGAEDGGGAKEEELRVER